MASPPGVVSVPDGGAPVGAVPPLEEGPSP